MQNCRKRQWQRSGHALGSLCLYGASSQFYLHDREDRSGARNIGTNGGNRGGWIYCPGRTLGSADHRRLDEPGEIVCAGFGARELRHDVDLRVRPRHRRANRVIFEWILKGSSTARARLRRKVRKAAMIRRTLETGREKNIHQASQSYDCGRTIHFRKSWGRG